MSTRKVTIKQLVDFLKSKSCSTPMNVYVATELLEDPSHPIAKKDPEDFKLREIFNHIEIINDTSTGKSE